MIDLPKDRNFQLWEYHVSHGSLLIRSPRNSDQKHNIDIKFFGVELISAPRHLKNIVMSDATHEEIQSMEQMLGKSIAKGTVFALESPTGRYLIVAAKMKVEENELDIFDSPFN